VKGGRKKKERNKNKNSAIRVYLHRKPTTDDVCGIPKRRSNNSALTACAKICIIRVEEKKKFIEIHRYLSALKTQQWKFSHNSRRAEPETLTPGP
jgi:hypothetical protein